MSVGSSREVESRERCCISCAWVAGRGFSLALR